MLHHVLKVQILLFEVLAVHDDVIYDYRAFTFCMVIATILALRLLSLYSDDGLLFFSVLIVTSDLFLNACAVLQHFLSICNS